MATDPRLCSHITEITVHYNDTLLPVHIVDRAVLPKRLPPRGWSLPLFAPRTEGTMNRPKQRGTAYERLIADGFAHELNDTRIDRAPLRGTADRGDIANLVSPFGPIAVEVKNVARLDLAGWVEEAERERGNADAIAGIVVHKRRGKGKFRDQYVTMRVSDLLALGWGVTDAM